MRKKSSWLLEILIWFILLVGLISIGIDFTENYLDSRKSYNVTFKDIDGLIVGSPVRLMGIQVGHVTEIKSLEDRVNIIFIITNKGVSIPKGSAVNVQFTGLAGSKSLEIIPSKLPRPKDNYFVVIEPVRIASLMNVQSDITRSILECSKIALNFLGHGGVEEFKKNIDKSAIVTRNINNSLNNTDKVLKSSNSEIITDSQAIQKFLSEKNRNIDSINNGIFEYPANNKQKVISMMNNVQNFGGSIENYKFDNYTDRFVSNLKTANKNVSGLNQNIKKVQAKNPDLIDDIYSKFNGFINGCQNISIFIENGFKKDNIHKLYLKTKKNKNTKTETDNNL
jgi:ABC-type transporter Mla subunit MlaD